MSKYALPDNCLDDRLGIVGTSGAGKTFTAKGFVERLLSSAARVCIPDPLGVWWGLRSSASGKRAGYPITVFGGKHADVDINDSHGAALARLIAKSNVSAVLDISEFPSMAARRRFMTAFAETIYEHNREPLHLVFDEADLWAPQRPQPEAMTLLGRMDEIVRRGRVRGFIPWLITQRPAVVHKDVLSQVDILVAMKLTSSQDRDALAGWIEGQADREEWKEIRTALPTLPRGDGYIWAPSHKILKRVTFPMIETFDSSRTPKRGERIAGPTKLATIDLSSIKTQLAAIKTDLDADDPKNLREIIKGLRAELAAAKSAGSRAGAPSINVERESAAHAAGYKKADDEATVYVQRLRRDFEIILDKLKDNLDKIKHTRLIQVIGTIDEILEQWPSAPVIPKLNGPGESYLIKGKPVLGYKGLQKLAEKSGVDVPAVSKRVLAAVNVITDGTPGIGGGALKMLQALAARAPARYTAGQWALLVKIKKGGSTWRTYLSRLRSAGLIDENAKGFTVSAAGAALANVTPAAQESPAELLEKWCKAVGGGAANLLRALAEIYPRSMTSGTLCDQVGMVDGGSTYRTYRSRLKANGLIEITGEGELAATPFLITGESDG